MPNAMTGCSSPSTTSASDAIRSPGAKHVPHTKTAVPAPTASSAGSGASSWTWRPGGKARMRVPCRAMPPAPSLRSLGRRVRALRSGPAAPHAPVATRYDEWLELAAGDRLAAIDAACAGGGHEQLARFRELDADVWALLLTHEYDGWPNIRALLPDVPDPALQAAWNGTSGGALAAQGAAFYRRLCERYARHGAVPLADASVLDFGCGWGRLTRMLARDVAPGRLYGCDPEQAILDVCRDTGVPARLARSEFLPERLPFDGPFDLAYAFSVFTHLSEAAHLRALDALHAAMAPGALLVVTVRPPAYMPGGEAPYAFVPHGGTETYGETVVSLPYVRERWSDRFALLDVDILLDDLFQVVLTLRRVSPPPR
jgi:SAM-dependent methyltransferase